jgi:hypothetical protein
VLGWMREGYRRNGMSVGCVEMSERVITQPEGRSELDWRELGLTLNRVDLSDEVEDILSRVKGKSTFASMSGVSHC